MNYYQELLESYSLLKKRQLKIVLGERTYQQSQHGQRNYAKIVEKNPGLVEPISNEMKNLTGMAYEDEEPQLEVMKPELQQQTKTNADGTTSTWWTVEGDNGPITIIGARGGFDKQGWKNFQGQVARRLEAQNPDLQSNPDLSPTDTRENPIISDTAKTQEEQLHMDATVKEISAMRKTTLPSLLAAGFAGDPGRVTKKDSDAPGWVKDPKNHLDSFSGQSLLSKVRNEKVTEVARVIEEKGGTFKGERANWEDKHEGVDSMHEFAKKCLKLQQFLNGDEGAFTDNDARWVHTNVILDSTNNKVRYNRGDIAGYGISFDHTTTARSKQQETMSVGLARIYNEKIQDWVDAQNKKVDDPKKDGISTEQFKVPDKELTPEQIKGSNWCSNFRGTQAEKVLGFVPHIMDISQMIQDYGGLDKRTKEAKDLNAEIARKKDIIATEMAGMFKQSVAVLEEAFKINDWNKKGLIISDEYTEGILQTVGALQRFGKGEREIVKKIFANIVSNQQKFFETVDSDFVFQAGGNTGPSEKADTYVTKLDGDDYLRALKDLGVKDEKERKRIKTANTKTLRDLLTIEARTTKKGKETVDSLSGQKLEDHLRTILKGKKLSKHLDTKYDLDRKVFTIPISLKTYITDADKRLGGTRNITDTINLMLDPSDKKNYKKGQDQARVTRFIEQNEASLGVGTDTGPTKVAYDTMLGKIQSIGKVGEMIKGDKRIKGMGSTDVAAVITGMLKQTAGLPSLSDKFLSDYLEKNFKRDKEDGREAVRLASFVERKLFEAAEANILGSDDEEEKLAYRTALGSISMFTGMSADSTFALEMDILNNKSKFYNQDDCVREQAVAMAQGKLPLSRTDVSNDWGNMSLKFERKGNSSVFGLKSTGCESIFDGSLKENVLATFLQAQAVLFETLLN